MSTHEARVAAGFFANMLNSDDDDESSGPSEDEDDDVDRTVTGLGDQVDFMKDRFLEFCKEQADLGEIEEFRGRQVDNPELTFLSRDSPPLSYGLCSGFMKWVASGMGGRRAGEDVPITESVFVRWRRFKLHYRRCTGRSIRPSVSKSVGQYICGQLTDDLNLRPSPIGRPFLTDNDFDTIVTTFWSPKFQAQRMIDRFQMTFWTSSSQAELLRIGSMVKSKNKYTHQKYLVFGIPKLIVMKMEKADNELAIQFTPPNGKNKYSKVARIVLQRVPGRPLYENPAFLFLVIAWYEGALPEGHTFHSLLDPALFDSQPPSITELEFSFHPDAANKPVFRGTNRFQNDNFSHDAEMLGYFWRTAMDFAKFDPRPTPHAVRRSRAIKLKCQGKKNEEISRALRHRWGTMTHKVYVGRIITPDATAAMYEQDADMSVLLSVHPDHVSNVDKWYPRGLPRDTRTRLFDEEDLIDAVDDACELRRELLDEFGVGSVSEILDPTNKAQIVQAYHDAADVYLELWLEAMREVFSNEKDAIDVDRALDLFPPGDLVDWDVTMTEAFLTGNDLASGTHALVNATVQGQLELDDANFDRLFKACSDSTRSRKDDGLVPVTNEPDNSVTPLDTGGTSGSPGTSLATSSRSASAAPPNGDAAAGTATRVRRRNVETDNDGIPAIDFTALLAVQRVMLEVDPDLVEAFGICTSPALADSAVFGCRAGHAPVNDVCNFCNVTITEKLAGQTFTKPLFKRQATQKLINTCAAAHARELEIPVLLEKYPSTIQNHPLRGTQRPTREPWSAFRLRSTFTEMQAVSKKSGNGTFPICSVCPHKPEIPSTDFAVAHCVVEHGVWAPVKEFKGSPDLDASNIGLPPTIYAHELAKYIVDPQEAYLRAQDCYNSRIVLQCDRDRWYAMRQDVPIPNNILPGDRNPPTSNMTFVTDSKYDRILERSGLIIRGGLCMLCVNDQTLSLTKRMEACDEIGFGIVSSNQTKHNQDCLNRHVREIYDAIECLEAGQPFDCRTSPHVIVTQGGSSYELACPDLCCRRYNRTYPDPLSWVFHLVAVHSYQIRGSPHRQNATFNMLCEQTEEDLKKAIYKTRTKKKRKSNPTDGEGDEEDE